MDKLSLFRYHKTWYLWSSWKENAHGSRSCQFDRRVSRKTPCCAQLSFHVAIIHASDKPAKSGITKSLDSSKIQEQRWLWGIIVLDWPKCLCRRGCTDVCCNILRMTIAFPYRSTANTVNREIFIITILPAVRRSLSVECFHGFLQSVAILSAMDETIEDHVKLYFSSSENFSHTWLLSDFSTKWLGYSNWEITNSFVTLEFLKLRKSAASVFVSGSGVFYGKCFLKSLVKFSKTVLFSVPFLLGPFLLGPFLLGSSEYFCLLLFRSELCHYKVLCRGWLEVTIPFYPQRLLPLVHGMLFLNGNEILKGYTWN